MPRGYLAGVATIALARGRLAGLAPRRDDALLAAAVAVAAQVETWATPSFTAKPAMAALALAVTLPLAWRRQAPVAVLGVGMAAGLTFGGLWPTVEPIYVIVALLVACYSVGAYAGRAAGLGCVAVVVAVYIGGAVLDQLRDTGRHGPGDVFMLAFLVGGAWTLGQVVHRRSRQTEELQRRAERLERERTQREAVALARERTRIARELHDVIAHSVSVMVIQAGAAEQLIDSDASKARACLDSVQEVGRATVVELRRLLGVLRADDPAPQLGPQPGMSRLPSLVQEIRAAGLPVELQVDGEPVPLPPGVDLSAYRIVQEALTNTLRHAGRATAHVRVHYGGAVLDLEIVDDGIRAPAARRDGHGLVGMRERAALYGGVLDAGPRAGGGYAVHAQLPVQGGGQP